MFLRPGGQGQELRPYQDQSEPQGLAGASERVSICCLTVSLATWVRSGYAGGWGAKGEEAFC